MDESLLREIANELLVPLFSGATLDSTSVESSPRHGLVAFLSPTSIAFKAARQDSRRLVLRRSQPFSRSTGGVVPEIIVVRAFAEVAASMESELEGRFKRDLLAALQRRVVAKSLGSWSNPSPNAEQREETILSGLSVLESWAARLYEGAPISASLGFRHKTPAGDTIALEDLRGQGVADFAALISNGHDTLMEFDFAGRLLGHVSLAPAERPPSFCPVRHAAIADWTTRDGRRVALVLNRLGEILALREQKLLFAFRSGRWSFLTHEPVLTQMHLPHDIEVRRAVYETCLDASFGRRGLVSVS